MEIFIGANAGRSMLIEYRQFRPIVKPMAVVQSAKRWRFIGNFQRIAPAA